MKPACPKARARVLREGAWRKTLATIILVTVPVMAVCAQFWIVASLERQIPNGQAAMSLEALQQAAVRLEASAQTAVTTTGLARIESTDRLQDALEDVSRAIAMARRATAGTVSGFDRSSGTQNEVVAELGEAVTRIVSGKNQGSNLKRLSEGAQTLAGLAAKAEDEHRRLDSEHTEFVRGLQTNAGLLVTLLLLASGFFVARFHFGDLKAALDVAKDTNDALSVRLDRLGEIHGQLEALKEQNQVYESKLSKSLDDAEAANEMLKYASHRFQELFEGLPVACFTTDIEGTVYEWNRSACELFQFQPEAVYLRDAFGMVAAPQDIPKLREACRIVGSGTGVRDLEWRAVRCIDRTTVEILTMAHPMRSNAGTVQGILFSCFDHTERKKAAEMLEQQLLLIQEMNIVLERQKVELLSSNEQLEELAATDGLTGLNNHRTFQDFIHREFTKSRDCNRPVSLALMDVDKFKLFNDEYGHQAGDEVLKKVASVIAGLARPTDLVARYGGEEFVVVFIDTTESEAIDLAEAMREAIESTPWPTRDVTASFGVATLNSNDEGPKDLIARADQALYASKERGRNRVTPYSKVRKAAA